MYVRLALGGGYLNDHFYGPLFLFDGDARGPAGAGEIAVGYAVSPTVVLGVGLTFDSVLRPDILVEEQSRESDIRVGTMFKVGPHFDWYPFRPRGLHLQMSPGFAFTRVRDEAGEISEHTAIGSALGIGVGYEVKLSGELAMGVMLRSTAGFLQGEELLHNVYGSSLMVSITYN